MTPNQLPNPQLSRRHVMLGAAGLAATKLLAGSSPASANQLWLPNAGSADEPTYGGTFRIGAEDASSRDGLDPAMAFSGYATFICRALYDVLVREDVSGQLENWLAEEFAPDAAAQVWTIRIREGVTFHDGKPLTIDDVIFSISRAATTTEIGRASCRERV